MTLRVVKVTASALVAIAIAIVIGVGVCATAAADVEDSIVDMSFRPSVTTIAAGETVTWANQGFVPHTVTAVGGGFDSGRISGWGSFSFMFPAPGSYPYFCTIHPDMRGEVIVTRGGPHPGMMPGAIPGAGGGSQPASSSSPSPGSGPAEAVSVRLSRARTDARQDGTRSDRVLIRVQAPRPGARLLLEYYSREHFTWREVTHGGLSARGQGTVRLGSYAGAQLRVVVVGQGSERPLVSRMFTI